jgi:hypothetical protein
MLTTAAIGVLAVAGSLGLAWLMVAAANAAYRNGCNDGYGYSREPENPGYEKAEVYLRKYCAHRWPELKDFKPKFSKSPNAGSTRP